MEPDEMRCRIGIQAHLGAGRDNVRHLRAFLEAQMADYFMFHPDALSPEIEEALRFLVGRGIPLLLNMPHSPLKPEDYPRLKEIAGALLVAAHQGEWDSSGLKPEAYLPPELRDAPTRQQLKAAFVNEARRRIRVFQEEYRVPFAHSSAVLYHHLFAEAGVDVICSEIGEIIPSIPMMLASNRGAARAYGRPWMIDFSTWWSPAGNVGEQVSPREGHTPWCLFTGLLQTVLGGTDYAQLEVDWAAFDRDYNLLPWGRAMQTLYSLNRALGPRGETETPLAVLIGHENGWPGVGWHIGDARGTGLWDPMSHRFMQTRDADLSMKILGVMYPGFERTGWDPEYPGFLTESPLGTLDIVADNLPVEKYGRYRALIALGYHRFTEELAEGLRQYVKRGGVLICGDDLFLDERERWVAPKIAEPLIGCLPQFEESALIQTLNAEGKVHAIEGIAQAREHSEWESHWLHAVQVTEGTVVAELGGHPYIVENRVGKGRCYFITALHLVGSDSKRRGHEPFLYAYTLRLFLHEIGRSLGDGVSFAPWTGLQHVYNTRPHGSGLLLVMNHGDMDCRRDAVLRSDRHYASARVMAEGTWEGWRPGGEVELSVDGGELKWSFMIPSKSFIIYELRAR